MAAETLFLYYLPSEHIYQIEFQIDFIGQRVIGPLVTVLHPDENRDVDFCFLAAWTHLAIDQIMNKQAEAIWWL